MYKIMKYTAKKCISLEMNISNFSYNEKIIIQI